MNDDNQIDDAGNKLLAEAAKLRTEIAPQRDLWPDIEVAIAEPRRPNWTPYIAQAAAVVLLVAGSSGITYMMTKNDPGATPIASPQLTQFDSEFTSFRADIESSQGFQDARHNLTARLDVELDRLSPDARAGVEENLAVIRGAIAEINSALEVEPDNALLQELLLKAYREELGVMQKVGGLTQSVLSRNDI
jgi:hypothetical protein